MGRPGIDGRPGFKGDTVSMQIHAKLKPMLPTLSFLVVSGACAQFYFSGSDIIEQPVGHLGFCQHEIAVASSAFRVHGLVSS